MAQAIKDGADDLDGAAKAIVELAFELGSKDNLTVQIVRVDELPDGAASEVFGQPHELPLPPLLEARAVFDGYRIVRELHGSSRSHIYLAVDIETDAVVTIKIPSIDLRDDPDYLKRFMMEEWVARRIDSPHVLKPCLLQRKRNFLYVVTEFIDGQTLAQWMIDNPKPSARDRARHRRADRQGPARVPPQGNAASGHPARQHHDRHDRHGEDHRFRFDQDHRRRRSRAVRRPQRHSGHRSNTPRPNIFWASRLPRAPTCSRSASSPIRC